MVLCPPRRFVGLLAFVFAISLQFAYSAPAAMAAHTSRHPNVLVIITDDQGHGDLGFHGNPVVRTPKLDKLARQSVRFEYFYVSPVCAPTRASMLTGRYNYRTGVVDTFIGRALMHSDEVTLAEIFDAAGYRTGIFGKWHLGDNYPMRPIDQGFQEALVLKGGGIGQPSDPPGGESYFDPVLQHNGTQIKTKGYCSDVFTDAAMRYIEENRARPFFVWLAFNAPHAPLQVPDSYYQRYKNIDFTNAGFPIFGHPLPRKLNAEITAKTYGMIENIDDNVGRLLAKLDELRLAKDTIVIFLTDNGPQEIRYNSGMLERKGSVHEGGIRVPFFLRWPGKLKAGRVIDRIAAHIDLVPTLLEACNVAKPNSVAFDGRSLWPLLRGSRYERLHTMDQPEPLLPIRSRVSTPDDGRLDDENFAGRPPLLPLLGERAGVRASVPSRTLSRTEGIHRKGAERFDSPKAEWPDRTLYFQWHRGDEPELYRAFAARSQRYKLVQPLGAGTNAPAKPDFKLYDMLNDPLETHNIASERPDLVEQMRRGYEQWFADVSRTRGYAPPRIYLGAPQENPVTLTRQDWRGPQAGWGTNSLGHWEVQVARDGLYDITLRFPAVTNSCTAHFSFGEVTLEQPVNAAATECAFKAIRLAAGPGRLEAWIEKDRKTFGVHYVEATRLDR